MVLRSMDLRPEMKRIDVKEREVRILHGEIEMKRRGGRKREEENFPRM